MKRVYLSNGIFRLPRGSLKNVCGQCGPARIGCVFGENTNRRRPLGGGNRRASGLVGMLLVCCFLSGGMILLQHSHLHGPAMVDDPSVAAASMFPINDKNKTSPSITANDPFSGAPVTATVTRVVVNRVNQPPVAVTAEGIVPPPMAEGEYRLRNASATGEPGAPRVLLYVTTHMSNRHYWYLKMCWPEALRRSSLLRGADVGVYATPPPHERRRAVAALDGAFPGQALTVHLREQESGGMGNIYKKNSGATDAMSYAVERGLFEGYDWVVRVNPDVIVRDDTFLVDTMLHDRAASAMLIDCMRNINDERIQIHTDFFMLRPRVLDALRPFKDPVKNAELSFTDHLMGGNSVLRNPKGLRWIPGADHEGPCCRAGFGRPMNETPITHVHEVQSAEGKKSDIVWLDKCPIPFVGEPNLYTSTA